MIRDIVKGMVPDKYHRRLYEAWNDYVSGWASLHYSQFGEDIIINYLLDNKYGGFFVDVGAFHPRHYSNTYFFYRRRKFQGINIEPNPDVISLFRRMRPRDTNLNCGVGAEISRLVYYKMQDPLCNTFSQEYVQVCQARGVEVQQKLEVNVAPLRDLLHTHVPKGREIDFLSVDVENFDLEVLQSMDWQSYRPKVVVVEDHEYTLSHPEAPSRIYSFLKDRDYSLKSVCAYSLIFLRNGA